jgi:hypothetical protein
MDTRTLRSAVVFVLLSSPAFAQTGLGSASLRGPVIVQPFPTGRSDVFTAPPGTYVPNPLPPGNVFFPTGGWGWWPSEDHAKPARQDDANHGFVAVDVEPATAQVFVDGLYVGTAGDIRGGRQVQAGAHRLELRAGGYDSTAVDIRVDPDATTVYRGEMARVASAAPTVVTSVAARPKTFYVIPGCYAGDKKPQADRLPRGCDLSRLREVPPTVARVS